MCVSWRCLLEVTGVLGVRIVLGVVDPVRGDLLRGDAGTQDRVPRKRLVGEPQWVNVTRQVA